MTLPTRHVDTRPSANRLMGLNRRQLLAGATAFGLSTACSTLFGGCARGQPSLPTGARPDGSESPPETSRLRLALTVSVCHAPQYLAEPLLKAEGFTDVHYFPNDAIGYEGLALATGEADILLTFAGPLILQIDADDPILLVAGGHVGCLELFGHEHVRTIRDLKGKTITMNGLRGAPHTFLIAMLAHVGLDYRHDVTIRVLPPFDGMQAFTDGAVDAVVTSPPWAQELRARRIGHSVVNSSIDRPWSQYFCCLIAGNRDFVRRHPIATKRAIRAILKAADMCAADPKRAADELVDRGFTQRPDFTLQAMQDVPYGKWRDYDAEDTVRFYSLRLHEAGLIKNNPDKILAQGADWRFFNELKRELKA